MCRHLKVAAAMAACILLVNATTGCSQNKKQIEPNISTHSEASLSAYVMATENGYEGTLEQWFQQLDQQSAYEIAVDSGFDGTEQQWQDALNNLEAHAATVVDVTVNEKDELVLTLSDETTLNVGRVTDKDTDASAIAGVTVTEKGELMVSYTDGTQTNFGKVVGSGTASTTEIGNTDAVITDVQIGGNGTLHITLNNGEQEDRVPTSDVLPEDVAPEDSLVFTVVFRDYDHSVLKTEEVKLGNAATAPALSERAGYVFSGWDRTFDAVTNNIVVTAQYVLSSLPMLMVSNVTAKAGETVTVDVSIVNNPKLLGAILTYTYDAELTLVEADGGPALEPLEVSFSEYTTPFTVFCDGIFDPSTQDGVAMSLTFMVPVDATTGQTFHIHVSHALGDVVNHELEEVELSMVSGTVTIM